MEEERAADVDVQIGENLKHLSVFWPQCDLNLLMTHSGTNMLYQVLAKSPNIDNNRDLLIDNRFLFEADQDMIPRHLTESLPFLPNCSNTQEYLNEVVDSLVDKQLRAAEQSLQVSTFYCTMKKKQAILRKVFQSLRLKYHRKVIKRDSKDPNAIQSQDGIDQNQVGFDRIGSNALIELGVSTGISLLFALLKQNWFNEAHPSTKNLCNDVLNTALHVIKGLPPLSLAVANKIPNFGVKTMNQVTEFLAACSFVKETNDLQGSGLCLEILLFLALQRGSLSHLLKWIEVSLKICQNETDRQRKISKECIDSALNLIHLSTGISNSNLAHINRYKSACVIDGHNLPLYEAVQCLLAEVVFQSESYNLSCTSSSPKSEASGENESEAQSEAISDAKPVRSGFKWEAFLWGSNLSHQLGDGSLEKYVSPKQSETFRNVQTMEAGQHCTFVLHTDGSVSACGKGSYGRLGLGDSCNQTTPKRMCIRSQVKKISSSNGSDGHSFALTEDGRIYSWGDGDYGKLGHGSNLTQKLPKLITGALTNKVVTQISAGYRHSAAVTEDGLLFTWGEGDFGRLGHGDSQSIAYPTQVKDISTIGQVSCGSAHTLALSEDGKTLWSFGAGDHGKLGHGEMARLYKPKIVESLQGLTLQKIQAGNTISMALTTEGRVYVWGSGACVGAGTIEAFSLVPKVIEDLLEVRIVDICVGDGHCLALSHDCSVYAWGLNNMGQCGLGHNTSPVCSPQKVRGLEGILVHQISAGTSHSLAWTALPLDRQVVLWHKPFCADLSNSTFETISHLLSDLLKKCGPEWDIPCQPGPFTSKVELKNFILSLLEILKSHFSLARASKCAGDVTLDVKLNLERVLYRFVDVPNCPTDILAKVNECLIFGLLFLKAPLETRINQAISLLQVPTPSNGQILNLILVLQSINDSKLIANLIRISSSSSLRNDDTVADKPMLLIKTLLTRIVRRFVEEISVEKGHSSSEKESHDYETGSICDLRKEEKKLLVSLIKEFVLCNLTDNSEEKSEPFDRKCVGILNFLLKLSTEVFQVCNSKSVKPNWVKHHLENSVIPVLLHTTLLSVSLLDEELQEILLPEILELREAVFNVTRNLIPHQTLDLKGDNCILDLYFLVTFTASSCTGRKIYRNPRITTFSTYQEHNPTLFKALIQLEFQSKLEKFTDIDVLSKNMGEICVNQSLELSKKWSLLKEMSGNTKLFQGQYSQVERFRQIFQAIEGHSIENDDTILVAFAMCTTIANYVQLNHLDFINSLDHSIVKRLASFAENLSVANIKADDPDELIGYNMQVERILGISMMISGFKSRVSDETNANGIQVIFHCYEQILSAQDLDLNKIYDFYIHKQDEEMILFLILSGLLNLDERNINIKLRRTKLCSSVSSTLGEILFQLLKDHQNFENETILVMIYAMMSLKSLKFGDSFIGNNANEILEMISEQKYAPFNVCGQSAIRLAFTLILKLSHEESDESSLNNCFNFLKTELMKSSKYQNKTLLHGLLSFISILSRTNLLKKIIPPTGFGFSDSMVWLESLTTFCSDPFSSPHLKLMAISVMRGILLCFKDLPEAESHLKNIFGLVKQLYFAENSSRYDDSVTSESVQFLPLNFVTEKSLNCQFEVGKNGAQIVTHSPSGRAFAMLDYEMKSTGIFSWKVSILKETPGNEGTCIGICVKNPKDFSHKTSPDMWMYKAYSGTLYHQGEDSDVVSLPEYSEGDVITVTLNLDNRTLSFGKNDRKPELAFINIPDVELFPCVVFYSPSCSGEKVHFSEFGMISDSNELHVGTPWCAPLNETMVQNLVEVLRSLYVKSGFWKSQIEQFCTKAFNKLHLESPVLEDFSGNLEKTESEINYLTEHILPILLLFGDCDSGLKVGSRIETLGQNQGIVLGSTDSSSSCLKIYWNKDGSTSILRTSNANIRSANHQEVSQASNSKETFHDFLFNNPEIVKKVKILSNLVRNSYIYLSGEKILSILRDCDVDADLESNWYLPPEAKLSATRKSKVSAPANRYVTPNIGKASRRSASYPSEVQEGGGTSKSVDLLSNKLVTSIIDEVTEKLKRTDSQNSQHCKAEDEVPSQAEACKLNKEDVELVNPAERLLKSKTKDRDRLINIVFKSSVIQFLASKIIHSLVTNVPILPNSDTIVHSELFQDVLETCADNLDQHCFVAKEDITSFERVLGMLRINFFEPVKKPNELEDQEIRVKSRSAHFGTKMRRPEANTFFSRLSNMSPAERLTAATAAAVEAAAINEPLRDMGFTDVHIREAIRVLNINPDDAGARSVSRCAAWMIDNPLPVDATMAGFQTSSSATSSRNGSLFSGGIRRRLNDPRPSEQGGRTRALSDIRHFLVTNASSRTRSGEQRQGMESEEDGQDRDVEEVGEEALLEYHQPWSNVFRPTIALEDNMFNPIRTYAISMTSSRRTCGICSESLNVTSTQHMIGMHPGCNIPLENAICGGLLDDNYVLCQECLFRYVEEHQGFPSPSSLQGSDLSIPYEHVSLAQVTRSPCQPIPNPRGARSKNIVKPDQEIVNPKAKNLLNLHRTLRQEKSLVVVASIHNFNDEKAFEMVRAKLLGKNLFTLATSVQKDHLGETNISGPYQENSVFRDQKCLMQPTFPQNKLTEFSLSCQATRLNSTQENLRAVTNILTLSKCHLGLDILRSVLESASALFNLRKYGKAAETLKTYGLANLPILHKVILLYANIGDKVGNEPKPIFDVISNVFGCLIKVDHEFRKDVCKLCVRFILSEISGDESDDFFSPSKLFQGEIHHKFLRKLTETMIETLKEEQDYQSSQIPIDDMRGQGVKDRNWDLTRDKINLNIKSNLVETLSCAFLSSPISNQSFRNWISRTMANLVDMMVNTPNSLLPQSHMDTEGNLTCEEMTLSPIGVVKLQESEDNVHFVRTRHNFANLAVVTTSGKIFYGNPTSINREFQVQGQANSEHLEEITKKITFENLEWSKCGNFLAGTSSKTLFLWNSSLNQLGAACPQIIENKAVITKLAWSEINPLNPKPSSVICEAESSDFNAGDKGVLLLGRKDGTFATFNMSRFNEFQCSIEDAGKSFMSFVPIMEI